MKKYKLIFYYRYASEILDLQAGYKYPHHLHGTGGFSLKL